VTRVQENELVSVVVRERHARTSDEVDRVPRPLADRSSPKRVAKKRLELPDVLSVDGRNVTRLAYSERRAILEDLNLNGRFWRTPQSFDDGAALWEAVCEHELEGVVPKRRLTRYRPVNVGWVKTSV
jgi:ATP-dependent DNA ligase